jgi:hypothetical protein
MTLAFLLRRDETASFEPTRSIAIAAENTWLCQKTGQLSRGGVLKLCAQRSINIPEKKSLEFPGVFALYK